MLEDCTYVNKVIITTAFRGSLQRIRLAKTPQNGDICPQLQLDQQCNNIPK